MKLPSDHWLCWKMKKLNLSLIEGYPTCGTDTSGLSRDQFIKVPCTQKWYDGYEEKKDLSQSTVFYWPNELVKLNILSPELLDSLLDHWFPSLKHRNHLEDGRGWPGTYPLFATRQPALVAA